VKEELLSIQYNGAPVRVAAYIKEGSRQWIICLHGLQSNKKMFKGLLKQPFLDDFSAVALDFVGFGGSGKPQEFPYTIESQAQVVVQIVQTLNIKKASIIGHSLGGMVGILLLEPLKDVISAFANLEGNLVLSDCGASKDVVQTSFEEFCAKGYAALKNQVGSESSKRSAWINDTPDYVFYATSQAIVSSSAAGKLAPLFAAANCRRLFVYGEHNKGKAQVVPNGIETYQINHSGHFMLLDNASETYKCLGNFLASKHDQIS
jgi:pimeloyl-ACP methyl ester carboxylesterase